MGAFVQRQTRRFYLLISTFVLAALFVQEGRTADPPPKKASDAVPAETVTAGQDTLLTRTAEAVLEVLKAYDQARLDQNVKAFVVLHALDAVQCTAGGPDPRLWRIAAFSPIGRVETMDLLQKAFAEQNDILTSYSNTVVRMDIASSAVLVVRRLSETYRDRRTGVERKVEGDHCVHVMVKIDGAWKILSTTVGLGNPDFLAAPATAVPGR